MKNIRQFITFFCFCLLTTIAYGQIVDNFSDGDFTNNPTWLGEIDSFQVSSGQVRTTTGGAVGGSASLYLVTSQVSMGKSWDFYFRMAFNPSPLNYMEFWLSSDSANLNTSQNGYFVKLGGNPEDGIGLFKKNGGTVTEIIPQAGNTLLNNSTNNLGNIRVTRSSSGTWEIFEKITTNQYISIGSAFDASISTSSFIGFRIVSTKTNRAKHFLDDINVQVESTLDQPYIQWQKCLGGTGMDVASSIQQCADGGYVVAGYTDSNDGNVSGNHGSKDFWVMKLDATSSVLWQKCLGGIGNETAFSVQQCEDGGFIVAGSCTFNNGDVSGNHGSQDFWILKLDATGTKQWQKSLGGTGVEEANSIQQCADGGYIVAGYTRSNNGDVVGFHGDWDYWVVKLGSTGNLQWQKCLGGTGYDYGTFIQECSDGGFIATGFSSSTDGDVSGNHGQFDYWIVKLSATGSLDWQKCLGGTKRDYAYCIQQCADGGFIVAGEAGSNDGNISGNHGYTDFWVVKLNASGILQWQKSLGGSGYDGAYSIQACVDGGFIVAGLSTSNDGDVSGNHGDYDYWVVKLDETGNIQWQKCVGGSSIDHAYSIKPCSDGGYIVAGISQSNDGDVSGNHGGFYDYWVVKLGSTVALKETLGLEFGLNIYPNPAVEFISIMNEKSILEKFLLDATGRSYPILPNAAGQLDIRFLKPGVYFLKVKTKEGVRIERFVKN